MADSDLEGGLYADTSPVHVATTTALLVLATCFVALRFIARRTQGTHFAHDDWACVVALLITYLTGANNYAMLQRGLGRHGASLDLQTQEDFYKLLLVFECIYVTGVASVKIALLLMYARVFKIRAFLQACYVLGGLTIAWWLAICLVCIFQCNPIEKAWQPWLQYGTCIDLKASFIGNAIPNIVTDVAILCLPLYQVFKLQINTVQKISLMGVFFLGTFVFFASIYRFTTIMQFDIMDTTWTLATACTWCVVEVAVGLVCVCLPTLRPLLVKISRKFGSAIESAKYGSRLNSNQGALELGAMGGTNAATISQGRPFTQITAQDDKRFGTRIYAGRSHVRPGSEKDNDSAERSDDEIPLHPEKGSGAVIHVNHEIKQTVDCDDSKNMARTSL